MDIRQQTSSDPQEEEYSNSSPSSGDIHDTEFLEESKTKTTPAKVREVVLGPVQHYSVDLPVQPVLGWTRKPREYVFENSSDKTDMGNVRLPQLQSNGDITDLSQSVLQQFPTTPTNSSGCLYKHESHVGGTEGPKVDHIIVLMMRCPDLLSVLAAQTPTADFMSLLLSSRRFKELCYNNLQSLVWSCARERAPHSFKVFNQKFYPDLMLRDPANRPFQNGSRGRRLVPGFRFVRFLEFREKTIVDIVRELARHGHRLPVGVKTVLAKTWLLMDVPDNHRRGKMIRNEKRWSHKDLFLAIFFLVKLDLRIVHPEEHASGNGFRSMLLAQRGLHYLRDVLMRKRILNLTDLTVEMRRTYGERSARDGDPDAPRLLGIPAWALGADTKEYFVRGNQPLRPADELILMEATRRDIGMERYIEAMITWGYVDNDGNDIDVFLKEGEHEDDGAIAELSKGVGDQVRSLKHDRSKPGRKMEESETRLNEGDTLLVFPEPDLNDKELMDLMDELRGTDSDGSDNDMRMDDDDDDYDLEEDWENDEDAVERNEDERDDEMEQGSSERERTLGRGKMSKKEVILG